MKDFKMQSINNVDENIKKIGSLFPNCLTEKKDENGEIISAIDFDMLKQELSNVIVEGQEERYQFTWPDKKKAILLANSPIKKTLRPCKEESVDFENTENLYIEGDNLDVLKLLQETYLGKVKMIYIDPPYNTGKDFVYEDNFAKSTEEYLENSGQFDEEGNRLFQNTESNGRYHTDWLNMIYPRLKVAKNLLAEDGVICISIDDNEVENIKKIANEIFGEKNFIGEVIRKTKTMTGDNGSGFNLQHENLIIYSKIREKVSLQGGEKEFENYSNPDNDSYGEWCSGDPSAKSGGETTYFPIENPITNKIDYPPKGRYWAFSKKSLGEYIKKGKIKFKENHKETERGFIFKRYKNDAKNRFNPVNSLFAIENKFMNQSATIELKNLFEEVIFNYPKPKEFIVELIKSIAINKDEIILDFFSGSATTAHAVMELNSKDGGSRKFIMIQLPENLDSKNEKYKNICEVGKARIQLASEEIIKKNKLTDIGFKVLKLDSTNMKDIYYNPEESLYNMLDNNVRNIKEDRTEEDLLFQVMLELGVLLSSKIKEEMIKEKKVFNVDEGYLMACFDENITEETIKAIANTKPYYFVMRDSSLANDSVATNFEQIFVTYSPDTIRKVL